MIVLVGLGCYSSGRNKNKISFEHNKILLLTLKCSHWWKEYGMGVHFSVLVFTVIQKASFHLNTKLLDSFKGGREYGGLCRGIDGKVCHPIGQNCHVVPLVNGIGSKMFFQCSQQENEWDLINTSHCHCKCPYSWFLHICFILSCMYRTCLHLPQGSNPEILYIGARTKSKISE